MAMTDLLQPRQNASKEGSTGRGVLRQAIIGLDDRLSRKAGVRLFSDDEKCILRFAPIVLDRAVRLSDGTLIAAGDTVADIHCWNDRVPPMPKGGADLAWAQDTSRRLRYSLRLLARAFTTLPELREARGCRAKVNLVGRGGSNASVTRIIERLGFEDVDEGFGTVGSRIHDAFENVLIGALVWTHNPEALRGDKLLRERRPVWSSRERLLALHGR